MLKSKYFTVPTLSHHFILPRAYTCLLSWLKDVSTAFKHQKKEENAKLTSGVSFGFELVLTHFDVAIKSLTGKYCTFH